MTPNPRLERTVIGQCGRAASALRYLALAALGRGGRPLKLIVRPRCLESRVNVIAAEAT